MKKIVLAISILLLHSLAFASDINLGLGYQFGLAKNFETEAKPEISHNFAFALRGFFTSGTQVGLAVKGALGGLTAFDWNGQTYTRNDGDSLFRFSGLLGASVKLPLTKQFAVVFDAGFGLDYKTLSSEVFLGENNQYNSTIGGWDTVELELTDFSFGPALDAAVQFNMTSAFYVELGISAHYYLSRQYTGSLTLKDKYYYGFLGGPLPDKSLSKNNSSPSFANILSLGLPYLHFGIQI
jgi:hypothetical protein